jgi:hypothetical protein
VLGVLGPTGLTQYVLLRELWPMTACGRGATCSLEDALATVRDQAKPHQRLFAWSIHELVTIRQFVQDEKLLCWYESHLENALPIARRWLRRSEPTAVPASNTLAYYLRFVGYRVPPSLGPGNTGKRIRDVRQMLQRHQGQFATLTPTAKGKWTRMLEHNRHDVEGLRFLMIHLGRADGID